MSSPPLATVSPVRPPTSDASVAAAATTSASVSASASASASVVITLAEASPTPEPADSSKASPATAISASVGHNPDHVKILTPAVEQHPGLVSNIADLTNRADTKAFSRQLPQLVTAPSAQSNPSTTSPDSIKPPSTTMIFSDFYKGPRSPLARLRQHNPPLPVQLHTTPPDWLGDEHADLLSKDRTRQKEAVRRYLSTKIKTDWVFQWPQPPPSLVSPEQEIAGDNPAVNATEQATDSEPIAQVQDETKDDEGYQVDDGADSDIPSEHDDDEDDTQSVYSVMSEDAIHFRPRMEWTSDWSDDEPIVPSPFRFESPGAVGSTIQTSLLAKQTRRRRAVREETVWNDGLACFEARRSAWTGAKTVRVRSKPITPPTVSPRSQRRFFFRRSMSGSPPTTTTGSLTQSGDGGSVTTSDASSFARENERDVGKQAIPVTPIHLYPVETLIPIGQPILPPNNPLRASITPSVYLNLYDKVVLNNLQPACPINLSDMIRSCVTGWKRDGEWPPRPSAPEPLLIAARKKRPKKTPVVSNETTSSTVRRMSFGLLGRDTKDDEPRIESRAGKGIRRSLHRAFGFGSLSGAEINAMEKV